MDEPNRILWAPWRLAYVAAAKPAVGDDPCFICRGLAEDADRDNLIVLRTPLSVVVLNRFPYNNGHLLVAPRRHLARLAELDDSQHVDIAHCINQMTNLLDEAMRPDGYNIGVNLGKAAGAGLPGHVHWHVVPRWNGDTNFMPILTDAKVIVQSLDALFDMIRRRLPVEA